MASTVELGEVTLFRRARSIIAESMWWNDGSLEWCDITAGVVHRSANDGPIEGGDDEIVPLPPPLGAFQPTADGRYVAASGSTVFRCERDGSNIENLASVDHRHAGIRFNEAKCDPFGRFVVGSMDVTTGDPDGAIYVVGSAGECETLIGGIGVANGFEWSADGTRMWFTDTAVSTIFVGDYGRDGVRNIEPFSVGRQSDGLAIDVRGHFWNGVYDEGIVTELDETGTVIREIDIPAGHVTSVAFGGPDLSTLFVATASEKLTEEQLERQPLTGSLFTLSTTTRGYPVRVFG